MPYQPVAGKGVSLHNMSVKVSDDGTFLSLTILDTPFMNMSIADAADLFQILDDVLDWTLQDHEYN